VHSDLPSVDAAPPVFVDDTGRRRVLTRRAGRVVVIGFSAYIGLVVLGFARNPEVGPVHLPTFGLPSLGLMVPPPPAVLGAQADRTAAGASEVGAADTSAPAEQAAASRTPSPTGPSTPAAGQTSLPVGASRAGSPAGPAPSARPAQPGTTTTSPSPSSPTSTTSSTTTTTSTTATTAPAPGQGQGSGQTMGQGTGSTAAKGPDGTGAPGQERKPTSSTVN
jgi:hypothetical protein